MIYRLLFRLVLSRIDPERTHLLAARGLRLAAAIPPFAALLRSSLAPRDERLRVRALGRTFDTPVGVAAGVDKDASWFGALALAGFGFVEIGTVTARAQPGNPRPRIVRLPEERALVNSMGFPNPGAAAVAERLERRRTTFPVGVNVGKSRDVPLGDAADDYRACTRALAPLADFVVVNVSSPNTPGLRDMQAVERLRPLIAAVRAGLRDAGAAPPLLVKIAPDLSDEDVDAVAELALDTGLDGIVAVNTTVRHDAPIDGGMSGAPLKRRAVEVLRRLYAKVDDRLAIVSVGGIESADDAWQRIVAGATLLEAYTGFVYGGPMWAKRINDGLAQRVHAAGASSVQQLVGSERSPSSVGVQAARGGP